MTIFRQALLAEGRQGEAAQVRADNGGFVNGAATLESVITKARRTLPEGSAWARHCYAPALTTMVNDASAARVDCASPSRLEYCTGEIIRRATEQAERADHPDAEKVALALGALGGRRAKEVLYGSEHQMRKVGEHRVAAVLCVKGRKREASEEEFDTIIAADLYLHAVAFVRSRIPCETVADVNRAEARMLNRMESTPLLRKFKSAFLDHFNHRQRAGVNLMRTLHAARHYDLIRAVEADTSEPAAAEPEPDDTRSVADTLSDAVQDENVPARAVKRQKTAPSMRIEDAVTVVILCAAVAALKNNDMSPHIRSLRTAQSQLGMLLHWIRWERTWSVAGSKASFYQGCTIRQALEGLRSDDHQPELEDER
ncbi:hypothetical protein JKP88DRAFT_285588 [Tribonema minus]|uniref:Uncharacterized protein n=1 Tax=Tribonema minus TaxID=303371 RepID=A0A835ZEK8_9STRA|nr:hypothetical protein JKP88DRAFT_285588 [Tribonema minus]